MSHIVNEYVSSKQASRWRRAKLHSVDEAAVDWLEEGMAMKALMQ